MHYLDESHILVFLVQILVLLVSAKVLGALCQWRGIPSLAGEILAGIVLGPTVFGRALPAWYGRVFPSEAVQVTMLDTVAWFGVLFLLLATGFEVSISTVWKQGKASATIGVVGVVIPFLMGCAVFCWLPDEYWGENTDRLTFTLFLSVAAAISAIPVIAKILHDLDILKSDLGLTTLSAFVVNDLLGWMAFTVVLGLATPGAGHGVSIGRLFFDIVLFGTVCLTVGSRIVGEVTERLQRTNLPQPGTTLTFVCCLGVLCGAITQWIGIHAIIGFFLAGIMAGNTPKISENTRSIISQMIHAIFVPIFFATIGVKVDFLGNFDWLLIVSVTAVAVGGKYVGAWVGGRLAGLSKPDSISIGIAHIPGGAMEIVIGMLALELKLIPENVFVAVVFAALSSSVAVGPLLAWSIRRRGAVDVSGLLVRGAVTLDLDGRTRWEAIEELCGRVAASVAGTGDMDHMDKAMLLAAVRRREEMMGTGLERGVAVPHARLRDLKRPMVAFGLSKGGIHWDAPDGSHARFVFLVLTPVQEEGRQVQILASIARAMSDRDLCDTLLNAADEETVFSMLNKTLAVGNEVAAPSA